MIQFVGTSAANNVLRLSLRDIAMFFPLFIAFFLTSSHAHKAMLCDTLRTLITFLFSLRTGAWLTYGGPCRICHDPYLLNQRQLKLLHLNTIPSSSLALAFHHIRCEGIVTTMVTRQSVFLTANNWTR